MYSKVTYSRIENGRKGYSSQHSIVLVTGGVWTCDAIQVRTSCIATGLVLCQACTCLPVRNSLGE